MSDNPHISIAKPLMVTPEIAARFIEEHEEFLRIHPPQPGEPRQRRRLGISKDYAVEMEKGKWVDWNPDSPVAQAPECSCGAPETHRFLVNGLQRSWGIVSSGVSVGIMYIDDADPAQVYTWDVGGVRRPSQYTNHPNANMRQGAVRVINWYDRLFDKMPLSKGGKVMNLTLGEAVALMDEYEEIFDQLVTLSDRAYSRTTIPASIILGALTIANREGYGEVAEEFAQRVSEPVGLDSADPAYMLVEKMNRRAERTRKRTGGEQWSLFVRCLNADINDDTIPNRLYASRIVWPRIGETEHELNKRQAALTQRKSYRKNGG